MYARQSRPAADASPPTIDDHWHAAYGFYLCDTWVQLTGNKEDSAAPGYRRVPAHRHPQPRRRRHPLAPVHVGGGRQAGQAGVFLDVYGVELDNDKLIFPEDQRSQLAELPGGRVFEEGETKCTDGKERTPNCKVVVWDNFTDTDDGTTYIADFDNIPINQRRDGVLDRLRPARTPTSDAAVGAELPELAGADNGQVVPTASTLPGATHRPGERPPCRRTPSHPPRRSTEPPTPSPATTVPATTVPATTPVTTGG